MDLEQAEHLSPGGGQVQPGRFTCDRNAPQHLWQHPLSIAAKCSAACIWRYATNLTYCPQFAHSLQISRLISDDELLLLGGVFALPRWTVRTVQSWQEAPRFSRRYRW